MPALRSAPRGVPVRATRRSRQSLALAAATAGALLLVAFGLLPLSSFVAAPQQARGGRGVRRGLDRPVSARALAPTLPSAPIADDRDGDDEGKGGDWSGPSTEDLARLRLSRGSNFYALQTEEDLQTLLEQMEQAGRRLLVVDYYAPWCRACQRLLKQLHKIAAQDEYRDVAFASVDFERSRELCKSRNMKKLPTLEIYRGKTLQQRWAGASKNRLLERLGEEMSDTPSPNDVETVVAEAPAKRAS